MKHFIAIVIFASLAFPLTAGAQSYGNDSSYQQNGNDMLREQMREQHAERRHQEHMMQEQNRQMQVDRMYQQQRLDNMRRESNSNYGLPPIGY